MDLKTIIMYITAVLCAGLVSFTMTPPVRVFAYKIGAIDVPNDARRMHAKPIPRIGGLAIFLGFITASSIFAQYNNTLYAVWTGGLLLIIVGIIDDIYRIPALIKFILQILAAGIAVWFGIIIDHITLFGHVVVLGIFEVPFTILWIVGLTNAINLLDGLDGLACGISAICSGSIFCVMLIMKDVTSALLTALLLASCIGFFPFNRHPARIFMGDAGALFLGYSLAVISSSGLFKLHTMISFLVPITVFALPLFETVFSFFRRLFHGKNPFSPDRRHIHHRLVDMGFSQRESVRILYAICAIMGLVAVVMADSLVNTTTVVKALILLGVAVVVLALNYAVMINPASRLNSGLFDSEDEEEYKRLKKKLEIADLVSRENREAGKGGTDKQ